MKKDFTSLLSLSVLLLLYTSCNKPKLGSENQSDIMTAHSTLTNNIKLVTYKTKHGSIKMLKFASWKDFEVTASDLDALSEQIEDSFVTANSSLSEEALNDLEDSLHPDFERPFTEFENEYQFTNSYRIVFNSQMENWLNQPVLDLAESPKNNTLFRGAELSLLNNYQQVMIGDSLYHLSGTKYAIVSNNYADAIDYLIDYPTATTFPATMQGWWFINPASGCALWKKRGVFVNPAPDRKIETRAGIRSFTVYCKVLAEVESYKQKSNGGWKRYRTDLGVNVHAQYLRDIDCDPAGPASQGGLKNKKRRELESHYTIWGNAPGGSSYRAENGNTIIGTYSYYGLSSIYTLAW